MKNGKTLAEQALHQIDALEGIFDAHEALAERARSVEKGERFGVPATIYRFPGGSALTLSDHTDYAGNIQLESPRTMTVEELETALTRCPGEIAHIYASEISFRLQLDPPQRFIEGDELG